MSGPVIFKELPETFPAKDKYKKPSVLSSVLFHAVLILVLVAIPFLIPQNISTGELLVRLVAPLGPPPSAPPPVHAAVAPMARPRIAKPALMPVTPGALVVPTTIPREVTGIVDQPVTTDTGVVGGISGGIPGGLPGGVLQGFLTANSSVSPPPVFISPPPPPPVKVVTPAEPVRVGGNVREPRIVKITNPVYPKLAMLARVSGTVVLEAIVTAEGTVSEINVISGHPLLVQAAIECLKAWRYEPTLLNGVPTPVILTAKIHFQTAAIS